MPLRTDQNLKLYYSIKEVAAMFGLNESTLRYWETELPQLRPKVHPVSKARQYTDKDIEIIKNVYNLVKVRGFKLAAARKMLAANKDGVDRSREIIERLVEVRDELTQLKKQLDYLT